VIFVHFQWKNEIPNFDFACFAPKNKQNHSSIDRACDFA
jgi:hypothetical protein